MSKEDKPHRIEIGENLQEVISLGMWMVFWLAMAYIVFVLA
jgi:hypothetical protein